MGVADKDEEIKQLYLEMYELLIGYAKSALENYALAEEAVQETFRIACTKPDDLLTSPNPRGWLTNTLKNVLRNMKRNGAKYSNIFVTSFESDEWQVDRGKCDEIDVDILYSDMSDDNGFQLLKKIVLEQRTTLEVASELGISVGACTKRVQRAKKSLSKKLSKDSK